MWEKLYKKHPESEVLLSEAVLAELQKGLKNEDSVVQMRFMELIVKIATLNENIFEFVKKSGLLHQAVELYNTPDMLLKLNVVEVMEQFGESPWTIKFLKDDDKVWQLIQKEAFVSSSVNAGPRHGILRAEVPSAAAHEDALHRLLQIHARNRQEHCSVCTQLHHQ